MRLADIKEWTDSRIDVLRLNVSELNLENIQDPDVVEGYESIMAESFLNAEQIDFNAIFEWLYSNAQLVKYGPWNGFGETIFNLMLSEADEKAFVKNAIKMHCLGIRDKEFNKLLRNFCN